MITVIIILLVLAVVAVYQLGRPLAEPFREALRSAEPDIDDRIADLERRHRHARSTEGPGALAAADQLEAELRDVRLIRDSRRQQH